MPIRSWATRQSLWRTAWPWASTFAQDPSLPRSASSTRLRFEATHRTRSLTPSRRSCSQRTARCGTFQEVLTSRLRRSHAHCSVRIQEAEHVPVHRSELHAAALALHLREQLNEFRVPPVRRSVAPSWSRSGPKFEAMDARPPAIITPSPAAMSHAPFRSRAKANRSRPPGLTYPALPVEGPSLRPARCVAPISRRHPSN